MQEHIMIEDEFHFLIKCSFYKNERNILMNLIRRREFQKYSTAKDHENSCDTRFYFIRSQATILILKVS